MTPSSSDAPETAHRAGGVAWAGLQFAAIAASLALCAHGLHSRAVLEQALWSDPAGAAGVGAVLLALLGALYLAARQWRLPFSMVYAAALVLGASAFAGLGPIAAVLLLLLSAYALGERVLGDTTDAWFGRPLAAIAKVALGCALVSLAVFALALTRFNNPFVYLGLLVLPLVLDWRRLGGSLAATYSEWRGWAATPRPAWAWAASLAVAFAVSMRLIIVLHPETGTDALAEQILAEIKKLAGDRTIRYIINTSADPDHTGGNVTIATAGRSVISGNFVAQAGQGAANAAKISNEAKELADDMKDAEEEREKLPGANAQPQDSSSRQAP